MGISYKNFWSLNVDEAVVTGILRRYFKKYAEVFMPINAQLKDIDLILVNPHNRKIATIQVKGSKAFEPNKYEKRDFKNGSCGWFFIKKNKIKYCTADYFVFLIYVIHEDKTKGRRFIYPHTITIDSKTLYKLCLNRKILHTNYSFYMWIDPKRNKAFDYRDKKNRGIIELDQYLDKKGLMQISNFLGIK